LQAGRLAGLGDDLTGITASDPAWTLATKAPLRLPVYYLFQFQTSDQGDFESLVRRLVPRKLGSDIGQRPMAVDTPMVGIPSAGPPLALLGALRSLVVKPTEWKDPDKTNFQIAVEDFVNRTSPLIADPSLPDPELCRRSTAWAWASRPFRNRHGLAGRTEPGPAQPHAGRNGHPGRQTSLTPTYGVGVAAGRRRDNECHAPAPQFARAEASTALHALRFTPASQTKVLTLTAPLHARMLASSKTVRAVISASRVPLRLFSAPMRRVTSAAGAVRRRQRRQGAVPGSIVERVNVNTVTIVPPVKPPAGLVSSRYRQRSRRVGAFFPDRARSIRRWGLQGERRARRQRERASRWPLWPENIPPFPHGRISP
jgi:hypothetical protein